MVREIRSTRGATLLEVLVAIGIFGLFLTAAVTLYVRGYQVYKQGTDATFRTRTAALAFEEVSRELETCRKIYSPSHGTLDSKAVKNGYSPVSGENTPFLFVKYDPTRNQNEVVGYALDRAVSKIVRTLYSPDFNPDDAATWTIASQRALPSSFEAFALQLLEVNPGPHALFFLKVNTKSRSGHGGLELETKARIQGGF